MKSKFILNNYRKNDWKGRLAWWIATKGNTRCFWIYQEMYDHDYWDTSCGEAFAMLEDTPKNNGYTYCPSCGKKLQQVFMGK